MEKAENEDLLKKLGDGHRRRRLLHAETEKLYSETRNIANEQ
jgi:hypothetical protein